MMLLYPVQYLIFIFPVILTILLFSVKTRKLTISAALTAVAIGLIVLKAAQLTGVFMLLTFFLLSVLATSHKKAIKLKLHPEDLATKGRNTGQVLANGGVAALTAILAIIDTQHSYIYLIMMAASLSSALADTLSSELGMVYGRKFFNILTFKKEANGLDGVISIEGLLIGIFGASIIAFIHSGFSRESLIIIGAGVAGNLMDSILGATLERRHLIGNNTVNFINTLFAALIAMLLSLLR